MNMGNMLTKEGVPFSANSPLPRATPRPLLRRYIRRALAAHNNGWEAMNMWTAAVLTAAVRGVDVDTINTVAVIWLVARVL